MKTSDTFCQGFYQHLRKFRGAAFAHGLIVDHHEKYQLKEQLSAEDWELFTRYQDAERGAGVIADADIFIEGFRMGARVILDVLLKTA